MSEAEPRVAHVWLLQEGDFITSTERFYNIEHSIIAIATASPYATHAMLYIGANRIVEATGDKQGVHTRNLAQALTSPYASAYTVRGLTLKQRQIICQYARHMLTTPYDPVAAILSAVNYPAAGPACFCSGLVSAAYQKAGIRLTQTMTPSPGALDNSNNANVYWLGWLKHLDPDIQSKCDRMLYQPGDPSLLDKATEWVTRRR